MHNGQATKYIFGNNMRIAQVKGAEKHFFHKDHLMSSTVMSDEDGQKVEYTEYMPFGRTRSHVGQDLSDYKFTDQELDKSTGFYNYDARLYDPLIGRFIIADSIVPDWFDPQSLNRYSYCQNNPIKYVDPSGHEVEVTFHVTGIVKNSQGGKTAKGYLVVTNKDTGKSFAVKDVVSGGIGYNADTFKSNPAPFGSYDILNNTKGSDKLFNRLEAKDSEYGNDIANFNDSQSENSLLRLHYRGGGLTWGCVSVPDKDAKNIKKEIDNTSTTKTEVKSKSFLGKLFGTKEEQTKYGEFRIVDDTLKDKNNKDKKTTEK